MRKFREAFLVPCAFLGFSWKPRTLLGVLGMGFTRGQGRIARIEDATTQLDPIGVVSEPASRCREESSPRCVRSVLPRWIEEFPMGWRERSSLREFGLDLPRRRRSLGGKCGLLWATKPIVSLGEFHKLQRSLHCGLKRRGSHPRTSRENYRVTVSRYFFFLQ